jgi:ABC-2 type transport system ATP-binding protein
VSKHYGSLLALNHVSLEVEQGEVFGYIGPNGAGKTTTMKIMVGLLSNFEGDVYIGGLRMPAQRGQVHGMLGYMPQSVAFQEWRTVNHALMTFGRLSGLSEDKTKQRISEVLAVLDLSDVRNKKIVELSGGMTQKVGLAQALLHNPKFLVLDEPLTGLDPASRYQFKRVIKQLAQDGITVFFSSHILSDVEDVATRIGILNRGHLVSVGTLDELRSRFSEGSSVEIVLSYDAGRRQKLKSVKGVRVLEQLSPNKLLARLESDADVNETIDSLIRVLLDSGNRIRSVMPLSPSLDEVYLKYVGESGKA